LILSRTLKRDAGMTPTTYRRERQGAFGYRRQASEWSECTVGRGQLASVFAFGYDATALRSGAVGS